MARSAVALVATSTFDLFFSLFSVYYFFKALVLGGWDLDLDEFTVFHYLDTMV